MYVRFDTAGGLVAGDTSEKYDEVAITAASNNGENETTIVVEYDAELQEVRVLVEGTECVYSRLMAEDG